MLLEQNLLRIEALGYIVNSMYQVHYHGPWHMVVGTPWDPAVIHYNGKDPVELAKTVVSDLEKRGEAKPITPAQKARERVRVAKATGVYRKRVKQGPVKRPARVRIQSKKPFFS
jgi:hypothetical protein